MFCKYYIFIYLFRGIVMGYISLLIILGIVFSISLIILIQQVIKFIGPDYENKFSSKKLDFSALGLIMSLFVGLIVTQYHAYTM